MITTTLFVVIFTLTAIFSVDFQKTVLKSATLAGIVTQGIWTRIRAVALRSMYILGGLWLASIIIFTTIGCAHSSTKSGFVLGIFIPILSFLYIWNKISCLFDNSATRKMKMGIVLLIILIAIPCFIFGYLMPESKSVAGGYLKKVDSVFAGSISKRSLEIVRASKNTYGFAEGIDLPICSVDKGTELMMVKRNYIPNSPNSEGMSKVMSRSRSHIFRNGNEFLVVNSALED